jgi:hypothetical protein
VSVNFDTHALKPKSTAAACTKPPHTFSS